MLIAPRALPNKITSRPENSHFQWAISPPPLAPPLSQPRPSSGRLVSHARPPEQDGRFRGPILRLPDAGPIRDEQPAITNE